MSVGSVVVSLSLPPPVLPPVPPAFLRITDFENTPIADAVALPHARARRPTNNVRMRSGQLKRMPHSTSLLRSKAPPSLGPHSHPPLTQPARGVWTIQSECFIISNSIEASTVESHYTLQSAHQNAMALLLEACGSAAKVRCEMSMKEGGCSSLKGFTVKVRSESG